MLALLQRCRLATMGNFRVSLWLSTVFFLTGWQDAGQDRRGYAYLNYYRACRLYVRLLFGINIKVDVVHGSAYKSIPLSLNLLNRSQFEIQSYFCVHRVMV